MSETAATTTTETTEKKLVVYRCRVGHNVPMIEGALQIGMNFEDPAGKTIGSVRTNQLCPVCLATVLNQLCETFPAPAESAEKAEPAVETV